ncbi:MAG: hypothetical protein HUU01_10495 [Saprospiraceae bacterium]|nr:hypothetical protein [Saprospiraceae bacterium]
MGQSDPLDDSPEQLEAREMLVERIRGLAVKMAQAPFYASDAALRLLDCALNVQVGQEMLGVLEKIRRIFPEKWYKSRHTINEVYNFTAAA